jgi:transposase-like protein
MHSSAMPQWLDPDPVCTRRGAARGHFTFPESHRRQIRSTNPLERLSKEIERRTQVVGIFPTRASVIRLVGMILAEQDDEWQDGRR